MRLGPHLRMQETPAATRQFARDNGYAAFQTGWANMQSSRVPDSILGTPIDEYPRDYNLAVDPYWVIHSAYVVHAAPKDHKLAFVTSTYLKAIFRVARALGASAIILHTGATKDKKPAEVSATMRKFLTSYGIPEALAEINETHPLVLAIENVAAAYEYNQNLNYALDALDGLPHIGWCLDLAHRHAAGVTDAHLTQVIERRTPTICHANYPGSHFGCGLDRHGWRSKSPVGEFDMSQTHIDYWEGTLRYLNNLDVPLIIEQMQTDYLVDEVAAYRTILTK